MKFQIVDEIPFPREAVFRTHRDKLIEMVPRMPNVKSIVTESRVELGDIVKLNNLWTGASDDVPGILKGFLKAEYLTWNDRATWDQGRWCVDWELDLHAIPGAIVARGHNDYDDEGDDTVVRMQGEFTVIPDKIPGVPSMLVRSAAPTIERFVVGLVEPNLRQTNQLVARWLEENG